MTKEVEVTSFWESCKWWALLFAKLIVVPIVFIIAVPIALIIYISILFKELVQEIIENFREL